MITIAQAVEDTLLQDDIARATARQGWLNLSAYARTIQPRIEEALFKDVEVNSIVTALARVVSALPAADTIPTNVVQSLVVHSNIEGITVERSEAVSALIRKTYSQIHPTNKTFLTVTQGINEITILAESHMAEHFRVCLRGVPLVYDKSALVGITAKFAVGYLDVPNLIYALTRRLAYKNINIIEVVSTATELTYVIAKSDLSVALEQLQKDI